MLFSRLVDADFKDTEDYYNRIEAKTSDRDWSELPAILENLTARLDAELARKAAEGGDTSINRLRQRVSLSRSRVTYPSLPVRERGSKPNMPVNFGIRCMSLPVRERGSSAPVDRMRC
jgi:hypothetical protein